MRTRKVPSCCRIDVDQEHNIGNARNTHRLAVELLDGILAADATPVPGLLVDGLAKVRGVSNENDDNAKPPQTSSSSAPNPGNLLAAGSVRGEPYDICAHRALRGWRAAF